MNTNVTYLSSRSLAVYEQSLLEQFDLDLKRNHRYQLVKVVLLSLGFVTLAGLALMTPFVLQQIWSPRLY